MASSKSKVLIKPGLAKKGTRKKLTISNTFKYNKVSRSSVMSPKETTSLAKIGRAASANAIRASKALGLSVTYMKNGVIYREHADGAKEIIKKAPEKLAVVKTSIPLKKGMVFHAKK